MGLQYIRDYYQVPAFRGAPVKYRGLAAAITSASGPHLRIRLVKSKSKRRRWIVHPTDDQLEYLPRPARRRPTETEVTLCPSDRNAEDSTPEIGVPSPS